MIVKVWEQRNIECWLQKLWVGRKNMSKVKRGGLGKGVGALMGNNISPKQEKKNRYN